MSPGVLELKGKKLFKTSGKQKVSLKILFQNTLNICKSCWQMEENCIFHCFKRCYFPPLPTYNSPLPTYNSIKNNQVKYRWFCLLLFIYRRVSKLRIKMEIVPLMRLLLSIYLLKSFRVCLNWELKWMTSPLMRLLLRIYLLKSLCFLAIYMTPSYKKQ